MIKQIILGRFLPPGTFSRPVFYNPNQSSTDWRAFYWMALSSTAPVPTRFTRRASLMMDGEIILEYSMGSLEIQRETSAQISSSLKFLEREIRCLGRVVWRNSSLKNFGIAIILITHIFPAWNSNSWILTNEI